MSLKSALDIAMERTRSRGKAAKLTAEQKAELAEIDRTRQAKIAEQKLTIEPQIAAADASGDREAADKLRAELADAIAKAEREADRKRKAVRKG